MPWSKTARLDCLMRIVYDVDESAIAPESRVPKLEPGSAADALPAPETESNLTVPRQEELLTARPERLRIPA